MMEVLPIVSIRDEDGPVIGRNLLNLAKLSQAGLPIAEGIVITPPELHLKTVLQHFHFKDREVFEQSLHLVKKEIIKIPCPQALKTSQLSKKIKASQLWLSLLEIWILEIRSRVWREGFSPGLTKGLSSQPLFFVGQILASGEVYYDFSKHQAEIKILKGRVSEGKKGRLTDLVKQANQLLFLPQIYQWIDDGQVKLTKVAPFTDYPFQQPLADKKRVFKTEYQDQRAPSAIKLFLEPGDDLPAGLSVDGMLICSEKVADLDHKLARLIEAATSLKKLPTIFKLSDESGRFGGLRGTLKLIHNSEVLKKDAETFLFARHKEGLSNVSVAIPLTRSIEEFLQIKRDLAAMGISRKGSLKLWLELSVPENLINLEDYLIAGFDGAIINLDELASWLGGFNPLEQESVFYRKQIDALIKFLEDGVRILHRANSPIIARGTLAINDELLSFLIDKGVWGVVVDCANFYAARDHLSFLEKRNLSSRLN